MLISPKLPSQPEVCGARQVAQELDTSTRAHLNHDCGLLAGRVDEAMTSDNSCFRLRTDAASHCAS